MEKVSVVGSGQVGEVLANGFLQHGYEVLRASREPQKLEKWQSSAGQYARVGDFAAAGDFGSVVVLAVKGTAAESALDQLGIARLAGKLVIDTTNPIAEAPPENGVLRYFTDLNESLMERLQKKAPSAHFVKAFSCVGNAFMVNPDLPGGPPTMFICGNDAVAKSTTQKILEQFGWEVADMGKAEGARAIEPLCMLWCIPGFTSGSWTHAFKLLRL
jgi:hypothetical protein